jgi:hypothetical protein
VRWFLIAALIAVLVLDIWFARHAANEEIGSATKYNNVEKHKQHSLEGPFIVGARDIFIGFTKFAEDNEGAITALSTLAIAIFTVVLAAATIGLWRAADQQKADMRESLRIASESAKAALIQANTMMSAERGYGKMSHCQPLDLGNTVNTVQFKMEIRNWGRTPIQVTRLLLSVHVLDASEPLPKDPPYRDSDQMVTHAFLVSQEPFFFWVNASSGEHFREVQNGTKILYLIGYVDYSDKFGIKHQGGYGRQYSPNASGLVFITQEGYNYDKIRGKDEGETAPS